MVEGFNCSAEMKGVALCTAWGGSCFELNLDTKHLRRIVSNLVSNAVKYTPKGSVIVSLEERQKGTALS